jgi:phage terminase large subunit GpA-like protein
VPCPWCGGYQVLLFKQLKHLGEIRGEWPAREVLVEQKGGARRFNSRSPEYIKLARVARYECEHCAGEIDDRHKPEMLARGRWLPGRWLPWEADSPQDHYQEVAQSSYVASHAGFWWNVLYSPFRSFSEVAAQFFKVRKNPKKFQIFINQWLAEPWKEIVQQRQPSQILQLRTARPALAVPEDALALTAGIDSQRRGFWVVIRAWALTPDGLRESHKIRHGWVATFAEVEQWVFQDVYRTAGGIEHRVWRGFIDTGGGLMGEGEATLTEQVYNWLRRSGRGRIFGSKGSSKPLSAGRLAHQGQPIDHYPSGKPLPGGLALWLLDTQALKDFIWARIENGLFHLDGGPNLSFEEDQIPENDRIYAAHLAAEIKERNKQGKLVWTAKPGRANHLLDCEVMAAGAAEAFNVWLLPRPQAVAATAAQQDREINPHTGRPPGQWLRG